MPTIDTDSDPVWVTEAWNDKAGDLRLRDALKPKHRPVALLAVLACAATGVGLWMLIEAVAAGADYVWVGVIGFAIVVYGTLRILEELDCQLREEQECRHCRKRTSRWEVSE